MKYDRIEELPVWQAASELALHVFALGEKLPLRRHRSLRDQIERAALSVSNNIAEGFERGTRNQDDGLTRSFPRRLLTLDA